MKRKAAGRRTWIKFILFAGLYAVSPGSLQAQPELPIWNNPSAEPQADVTHYSFQSPSGDYQVGYNLLLPPDYDSGSQRYPILYVLHGVGGNENSSVRAVAPKLAAAMQEGVLPSFIVVFVNGADYSFYADSPDGSVPGESTFISGLIPHVDATYRTIQDRRGRAIEGFSMGGFGALVLAMKHAELFASVVAYAPALLEVQQDTDGVLTLGRAGGTHDDGSRLPSSLAEKNRRIFQKMFASDPAVFARHSPWAILPEKAAALRAILPLKIITGTADGLWNSNQMFSDLLRAKDYAHDFEAIESVAHDLGKLYEISGVEGALFHARAGGW